MVGCGAIVGAALVESLGWSAVEALLEFVFPGSDVSAALSSFGKSIIEGITKNLKNLRKMVMSCAP